MKPLLLLLLLCYAGSTSFAQSPYWQQRVNYEINASLNDADKIISADISIDYTNNSPDTLSFIWFHIWPNAYKNNETALARQLKKIKSKEDGFLKKDKYHGYIDGLNFTVAGKAVAYENDPDNIDIIKLPLPELLLPGKTIRIQTPFQVKLPYYFSRSGYYESQFMVTQWYPKPAVYDHKGWHKFPYLSLGEFYSEYGRFKVSITLPSDYVVAASGKLRTAKEYDEYKRIGSGNYQIKNWIGSSNIEDVDKNELNKRITYYKPLDTASFKTLEYESDSIPDFAWFANKNVVISYDTIQMNDGRIVDAFSYYNSKSYKGWTYSALYVKDAVKHYSKWIGDYPYPIVQAVEGPGNNSSGGMEYPMVTIISAPDAENKKIDGLIAHEVGHNWFMGILGSNERDHPWMDEGLNTFIQLRYECEKYRGNLFMGYDVPLGMKLMEAEQFEALMYQTLNKIPMPVPVETASADYDSDEDYGKSAYLKTALWTYIAELTLGKEAFAKALHDYYNEWKFRHPYPEDLKRSMEQSSGHGLDQLFNLLYKKGNFE